MESVYAGGGTDASTSASRSPMSITFHEAIENYLKQHSLSQGTLDEYAITLRKWNRCRNGVPLQQLDC